MQGQILGLAVNDPLAMPCLAACFSEAVDWMKPGRATAAGVGRFELGEPLISRVRQCCLSDLRGILEGKKGNMVLVSVQHSGAERMGSADIQPFRYRNWMFAMSGRIRKFDAGDDNQLAMPTYIEKNIRGSTVAEVLFHQFLAFLHRQGLLAGERYDIAPLRKALESALSLDDLWFGKKKADACMLLADGSILLGAALERPIYMRKVDGIAQCPACGTDADGRPVSHPHVRGVALLDLDGLPGEEWQTVGPNRVFQVDRRLNFDSFGIGR